MHKDFKTYVTMTGLVSAHEKLWRTCRIARGLVSTIGFLVSCASTEWLSRGPAVFEMDPERPAWVQKTAFL